jgi:all-trans-8'-apo-beta-carotenal 15,15'-oxygenase
MRLRCRSVHADTSCVGANCRRQQIEFPNNKAEPQREHEHRRLTMMNENVSITNSATPDLRQLVALQLQNTAEEVDAHVVVLQGELPSGLDGVWWRNGPARFERGGVRYGHPFDGDGMIARFDLAATGCRIRTRFVQTPEFIAEQRADKILYRGFGTQRPGGIAANVMRLQFKNPANTSVVWHAGQLLALWEGGAPTRIEPTTLDTMGRENLNGLLKSRGPTQPTFSAHPCLDPTTGTLYNFGLSWGLRQQLNIYATDHAGMVRVERTVSLDRLTFIHDFMITPHWYVFLLPAVRFDIARMALGLDTPVNSLRCEPQNAMTAMLVPRNGGTPIQIPTVPGFVFHFAGAFEDSQGRVVCDIMLLDTIPAIDQLDSLFAPGGDGGCAQPLRLVLDTQKRVMYEARRLDDTMTATELPITAEPAGIPYRSFWATATSQGRRQPYHSALVRLQPNDGIVARCDVFPAMPSEPCFVRKPDAKHAEDGWILSVIHQPGSTAELWVLDAETLTVVCRLGLPVSLPPSLHGCWAYRHQLTSNVAPT